MTTPDAAPAHVRTYLDEVRHHLRDLSPDDRAELIAPVEQRLRELTGGPADVERQFGRPAELAAELRSSAGYPNDPSSPGGSWLLDWFRETSRHPAARPVISYLVSLRPAWWAARGYLVLGALLASLGSQQYGLHTIGYYNQVFMDATPPRGNVLWVVVPLTAIVASIVLGLLTPRLPPLSRWLVMALNGVAVIALLAFPTWWMPPAGAFFAGLVN